MIGFEREISARTAGWTLFLGGCAFVLATIALAVAYVAFGVPVNGEIGMPPSGELTIIFVGCISIGVVGALVGLRNIRRAGRN